jgi:[ribosomal protein S18]-alanine N-acetyltransferase
MSASAGQVYTIRACRPEDLDQILSLEKESFPDPFDRKTFSQILSAEPDGFLVAEGQARLLGYIAVVSRRGEGSIYSFAVEPGSRRKGVGRLLMEAALRYLSQRADRAYLQVSVKNAGAIRMYEKFSFVTIKTLKKYYPNGDDAFQMVLELKRRSS